MSRTRYPLRSALAGVAVAIAWLLPGCAGTALSVPKNHPGHPDARSGKIHAPTALAEGSEPQTPSSPREPVHEHGTRQNEAPK